MTVRSEIRDRTEGAMYWAEIGDNRVGPLMREMIEAIADSDDPHFIRSVALRIRRLAGSLETIAYYVAQDGPHDKSTCPQCRNGSIF